MEEFEITLRDLIPARISEFPKLITGEPYFFDHITNDRSGSSYMYYWFSSANGEKRIKKRVNLTEVHRAFERLQITGVFDRAVFQEFCPKSALSGPCGFAVIGRILEALGVAKYCGRGTGFKKTSAST